MAHLSREEVVEAAEQQRPDASVPHLAACETCRAEVEELRALLEAIADVDVPEPSPLFWSHLSARINHAVAGEPAREPWWTPVLRWRWAAAGAAGVAVLAVAVVLSVRPNGRAAVSGSNVSFGSASAVAGSADPAGIDLADPADDPSLNLLGALAEDLDWDTATEAGITVGAGAADRVADELSEGERTELQRLLTDALSSTSRTSGA
jgi:hypothetical protein